MPDNSSRLAVLFSGGTDSTAAAALLAPNYREIHLLTYRRYGFHHVENARVNCARLQARFPDRHFIHHLLETTPLARWVACHRRWHFLRHYGFFTLQNCGHCALTNHLATLAYCLHHGLSDLADGITYDWPYFPGHMDRVIERLRAFHRQFGCTYHTPVLSFAVEPAPSYFQKIHSSPAAGNDSAAQTTGRLLFQLGLADTTNYKGTKIDRQVQARCYQFTVPNLFIYWVFRAPERKEEYAEIVARYFDDLITDSRLLLEDFRARGARRELFAFLDQT